MSAVLETMQSAAAKLPPATSRTQSYRPSNAGQSKAANKYHTMTNPAMNTGIKKKKRQLEMHKGTLNAILVDLQE